LGNQNRCEDVGLVDGADVIDRLLGGQDHLAGNQRAEANVVRLTAAYALLSASPVEKDSLDDFKQLGQAYKAMLESVLDLSRKNQNAEALVQYNTKLGPTGAKMTAALYAIAAYDDAGATAASDMADVIYASTSSQMMIVIALAATALLVSLGFVIRSVANPIVTITGSMRKLAEGDVTADIPFAGRADEIGAMAAAVETFRQAAVTNARHVQEAEVNRLKAEANRIADQKHAEAEADERLNVAAAALAAGLKRLASGDLAFHLTEAFAPGFEGLRLDFNSSVRQLGETLSAMSESIATMDTGTREISSGANDLSKRTEQQAASLEETAAALDQITANVANSSKRTEEARIAATQATQSAVKSAEVVKQAEEAMGRIETSSQHISSIIGVIDEIAFQTNLLALAAALLWWPRKFASSPSAPPRPPRRSRASSRTPTLKSKAASSWFANSNLPAQMSTGVLAAVLWGSKAWSSHLGPTAIDG
jgi:methyl-accepting chemotaxis protein